MNDALEILYRVIGLGIKPKFGYIKGACVNSTKMVLLQNFQ